MVPARLGHWATGGSQAARNAQVPARLGRWAAGGSQAASGVRVPARRPLGAGGSPARVPWRRACRRRAPRREAGGRGARAHDASFPRCFTKVPVSVATCDLCCARGPSNSLVRFAVSSVSSSPSVCSFGSHVAQSHACLCSAVHGPSVCSLGSHASRRFSVSTLGSHVSRPAPQARLASVRMGIHWEIGFLLSFLLLLMMLLLRTPPQAGIDEHETRQTETSYAVR